MYNNIWEPQILKRTQTKIKINLCESTIVVTSGTADFFI